MLEKGEWKTSEDCLVIKINNKGSDPGKKQQNPNVFQKYLKHLKDLELADITIKECEIKLR